MYAYGAMSPHYMLRFGALATDWIRELAGMGLRVYGRKVAGSISPPPEQDPAKKEVTVILGSGQRIWLTWHPGSVDDPRGDGNMFFRTEVRGEHAPPTKAILAALAALEAGRVEKVDEERMVRYLRAERDPEASEEWLAAEEGWSADEDRLLAFARTLLGFHRPDLDQESDEGIEMLAGTSKRVAAVGQATRQLADYLEFGATGRNTRREIADAQMDVYAAELHEIAGMSEREIADKFRVAAAESERFKGGSSTVRKRIGRGNELMGRAMGEEAWRQHVERQRARIR